MCSIADPDVQAWASHNNLRSTTLGILVDQGFTSLALLCHLSPDDVTESFQKPGLLPLAQCLELKRALKQLFSGEREGANVTRGDSAPFSTEPPGLGAQQNYQQQYHNTRAEEFRFLLLGKTGSGKSSTGNTILGAPLFSVGEDFGSVTNECELRRNHNLGRKIEIMDSPGLFDTRRSQEEVSVEIVKAVACMHPGPHAILYVIQQGRYTDEEYAVYKRLKALFDDHLTKYLVVLFTGGDRLERCGKSLESMLQNVPEGLGKVLQECGRRYILFNNLAYNKQPQVEQLFHLVNTMTQANGAQPYTCPKYKAVGQGLEEEVSRRLEEVEKRDLEKTRYVQQLQRETEAVQEALQQERLQFQQREEEREEAMRKEDEKREERMQEMMKTMQEQQLSLEKQQEEERMLREQTDAERREQINAMQEQREREMRELREREEKMQDMLAKEREEDRRRQEERDRQFTATMKQMQDAIAKGNKGEAKGFWGKVGKFVGGFFGF